ncbi:DUF2213 domain-containing protein [Novosphingobium sp. ZW T3_23]|uniref:DUF2213 domain-containing protein n=1 Tax=Novosphingobium sp. ZW T3_23 TaxID=3378084 RepID=UPI003854323D
MVQLCDTLDAATTARICADGSLVAEVRGARVGIQTYLPDEAGAPENFKGSVVRAYRPEDEVFSRDSMASFAAAVFTINHPAEMVDAANWKQHGVGEVNGDIVRDGEFVRVPVIVRDAAAVETVRTTHKQLSMGYTCTLDWTPGVTPSGEAYDAVQRDIRINHIAAVPAARGGPELKISDERPSPPEKKTMKIKIGDAEVDATNGEAVKVAVDAALSAKDAKIGTLTADLANATTSIQAKDGEIAALNAKLADAEVTPAKLQALADARADVIGKAKAIAPNIVTDGKTDAEIRKEAVTAKLGDAAKDMADAAIEGAFVAFTKDAKPAQQVVQPIGSPVVLGDAASEYQADRAKRRAALSDAWRQPADTAA